MLIDMKNIAVIVHLFPCIHGWSWRTLPTPYNRRP